MKKLSFLFALILTVALFQSCEKEPIDGPVDNLVAPELPPAESFIMPFDNFEDTDTMRGPFRNWFYAASNVVVWNTVLTINLAVPVASFYASFNSQAEFQGDLTWLWAYSFPVNGVTYNAELYGTILSAEEVKWEMYISQQGGFSNVLWYSGITATDRTYAQWTLNRDGNNPMPFIQADFQRNAIGDAASIRYTNIIPNVPENGGYIEFRREDGATPYDRAYDVYKAEIDNLLEIKWSSTSHEGRVRDEEKYDDTEWHCWGSNLMDEDC